MKKIIQRTITVSLTLDSSEAIMFTKGGMHKIKMNLKDIFPERFGCDYDDDETDSNDDFTITIQMERDQQGRYDFITGEAKSHKEQCTEFDKDTTFTPANKL
jgi:hypothetical protein